MLIWIVLYIVDLKLRNIEHMWLRGMFIFSANVIIIHAVVVHYVHIMIHKTW